MIRKAMVLIILSINLAFISWSLGDEKESIKPGMFQIKPPQAPTTVLPDLIVESIWLDNQCRISFKLKNAGLGGISDGDHSGSLVRVQYGKESKEFFLSKVDPDGKLKKAGGFISFDTEIKVTSSVDVKVTADSNQKIKESEAGERNNERFAKLIPQCTPLVKLSQEMVSAEIKPLPFDIAVDKIYVNEPTCKIHVVLRNLGEGKVPDEVYKVGKLRILSEYFKSVSPWSLSQVDTGRELNGAKKLKDFDTGLVLNRKEKVTFRIENVKDRVSSDDQKTVEVTPPDRCLQVKTTLTSVSQIKVLPKIEPIKEAPPQEITRTPPITRPGSPIVEPTPPKTGISTGPASSPSISVISPSKGEVLSLGSTFTIKWKAPEGTDPWVAIDLFVPDTQLTPSNYQKTWSYLVEATSNDGAYEWENISFSTPYQGPLQLRIRTLDGKVHGDSEIFTIGPPKEER